MQVLKCLNGNVCDYFRNDFKFLNNNTKNQVTSSKVGIIKEKSFIFFVLNILIVYMSILEAPLVYLNLKNCLTRVLKKTTTVSLK